MGFSGCYTQLYTRGYAERAAENYPGYDRSAPLDTNASDSGLAVDSAAAEALAKRGGGNDTLRPGTVIVNNYYRESPYYRGYLINDWDYPSFSFSIYSSRYRDYSGAYWWNDPWYRSGGYHRGYGGYRGGYDRPSAGGGSTGPYQSDKRIFAPAPDQPVLHKGRRASQASSEPAPKYSSESGSSSSPSSSSSSSSSSSGGSSSSSASKSDQDDHPQLHKGRRK
jgi:hypothetical protein